MFNIRFIQRVSWLTLFFAVAILLLSRDAGIVQASNPDSEIHPKDDVIVEFDTEKGSKLLLDTIFNVQPDGHVELIGHQFREDIPYSGIATPWVWAGKLISFDNRCTQIVPLGNPQVVRMDAEGKGGMAAKEQHAHDEEQWGKIDGESVLLEVEVIVDPDMHELEIVDESLQTMAKFDVAVLLESYCELHPESGVCINRKNKIILLDDADGTEDLSDYLVYEFENFDHLEKMEAFTVQSSDPLTSVEVRLESDIGTPTISIDLGETSQYSPAFTSTFAPFDESKRKIAYNGFSALDDSANAGSDLDGAMTITPDSGVRGIAFTLGAITLDSVLNKSDKISAASVDFDKHIATGELNLLKDVAQSIAIPEGEEIVAKISIFDENGEPIGQKQKNLLPIPGFHTFVGLITPNSLIGKVEIEYSNLSSMTSDEGITDLMIVPESVGKLPSLPYNRVEQPCPGAHPFSVGPITEFAPISELNERRHGKEDDSFAGDTMVPPDDSSPLGIARIQSYIDILEGRGYRIIAPDATVDDRQKPAVRATATPTPTRTVARPTATATPTRRIVVTPIPPTPKPTPIASLVIDEAPQRNILIRFFRGIFGGSDDSDVRDGTFSRATGGTQDGSNEESGGSCNLPGNGYEGLPLLAVLLLPAWLKYSRRGKR